MLQQLLFPEAIGAENFDPAKTKMTVAHLVEQYKKDEAKQFEKDAT